MSNKPLTISRKQANVLYRTFKKYEEDLTVGQRESIQTILSYVYNHIDEPMIIETWKPLKQAIDECFTGSPERAMQILDDMLIQS